MDQKYKRIKVIGQGSFGKAYLVRNTEDNVDCVVKQMETAKMEPSDRNAAVKEATILKKMEHPNIIQYQEVFMTRKGRLCIVMEYADGGDIHTVIKSQAELLDEGRITSWFVQACFALLHVHDLKVLHRDLKTQNIFLTSSGQVKLGDFGIARVLEATKEYAKTMVGTPYYLSPEIIQDRPYRFKSDVWSLGIVLFEMASLQHPFEADNLVNLAAKIVSEDIPKLDGQYSNDLKALVCRMLSKREESRPNVREILQCTFLQEAMHECNAKYHLGLDLSPFEVKRPAVDAVGAEEADAEAGVDGSECAGDVGVFSGESDNEESNGAGTELERSAANLKFGDTTMMGRVDGLRKYLNQQMSRAEFDKARTLVMESGEASTEELQEQVAGVIGAEKAAVLVSIFQLLCFLEQIASQSGAVKAHSSADYNPLKEVIMEKFRKWDVNGDGFISKDELQHVLCTLGLSEAEVVRIFSTADSNRDDKIDYNEFVSWLYSTSCPALDSHEQAVAVKVS